LTTEIFIHAWAGLRYSGEMNGMRLAVFGGTGFVGSVLRREAQRRGIELVCFSRCEREGFRVFRGPGDLDACGAVVNLAGEPILGLWTAGRRRRIVASRVEGTRRIVEALRGTPVRTLINASAIGYYGDTGETEVSEDSPAGTGFLAETCEAWEAAAEEAADARVVRIRIGFVIGDGGAMHLIRPVFQAGLGGNLGSGKQWMSCIHVEDVAGLILWALETPSVSGPVNAVMPEPVRNAEFTKTLAAAVRRPAIFPVPAFALKLILGELSRVMLDSARVRPDVATKLGYAFRFPTVTAALQSSSKAK